MKYVNLFLFKEIVEVLGDESHNYFLWVATYSIGVKYKNNIILKNSLWSSVYCIDYDVLPLFIVDLENVVLGSTLSQEQKNYLIENFDKLKDVNNIPPLYIYENI